MFANQIMNFSMADTKFEHWKRSIKLAQIYGCLRAWVETILRLSICRLGEGDLERTGSVRHCVWYWRKKRRRRRIVGEPHRHSIRTLLVFSLSLSSRVLRRDVASFSSGSMRRRLSSGAPPTLRDWANQNLRKQKKVIDSWMNKTWRWINLWNWSFDFSRNAVAISSCCRHPIQWPPY